MKTEARRNRNSKLASHNCAIIYACTSRSVTDRNYGNTITGMQLYDNEGNERLTVVRYLPYPLRSRLSNNSFLNEAPRDSPPRFRESISSSLSLSLSPVSRRVNTHSLRHLCRILRVFQRARFPSAWNDPLELSPRAEMDGTESGNDRARAQNPISSNSEARVVSIDRYHVFCTWILILDRFEYCNNLRSSVLYFSDGRSEAMNIYHFENCIPRFYEIIKRNIPSYNLIIILNE